MPLHCLTILAPTHKNCQTHSNNSRAVHDELFECDHFVGLAVKELSSNGITRLALIIRFLLLQHSWNLKSKLTCDHLKYSLHKWFDTSNFFNLWMLHFLLHTYSIAKDIPAKRFPYQMETSDEKDISFILLVYSIISKLFGIFPKLFPKITNIK